MSAMDLGERVRSMRKRRGLGQAELAAASGVSASLISKLERGEHDPESLRMETLRKLAIGLRVRTSMLLVEPDTEHADSGTVALWEPVRRALVGQDYGPVPEEPATVEGVTAGVNKLLPLMGVHRYGEMAQALPGLLRDADDLGEQGRAIRSRLLNTVGWLLTQTRQFDTAELTLERAVDEAEDSAAAASAVNTRVWALLRQGRLDDARALAIEWADDIEPKFSKASAAELSAWGRLWCYVANVAVRDNQPGRMSDALNLARAAAHRLGTEVMADNSTTRTFGPVTVAQIAAESHVIAEQPDKTLAIAERLPVNVIQPVAASRLRHRLDKAHAYTQLHRYPEAVEEIQKLRQVAPEWVVQQRYARDVLGAIVSQRRTLTDEMRELADFVRLEY
jgi:transcriptional regulator with XRE-family HTH domain/tetratricopeptide (TPR) repeat protein